MKKLLLRVFVVISIAVIAIVGIIAFYGYIQYKDAINKISLEDAVNKIRNSENYIKYEDMSEDFKAAILAVEDHRFYSHFGIDILATSHAILVNVASGSFDYGASSITQQTGRLLYFTQERQVSRKIAELFVALDLENNYSKNDILELYVNIIYYGEGYYGIGNASKGYFDKLPNELTFEEATFLAGVPNAPSIYSTNKKLGEQRRLQVVDALEKYKDEAYNQ